MGYKDKLIHLYEDVLHRRLHSFPSHFFVGDEGMRCAAVITRYVLEQKVMWNRVQICTSISHKFFATYRLTGMLKNYFQKSIFAVLENAYPGEFHPWELVHARRKLFSGQDGPEAARCAVRWMVLDELKYTEQDLDKISVKTFTDHNLYDLLHTIYRGSPVQALQDAGFRTTRPWEMGKTPQGYWKGETGRIHGIAAVKWLVEDKLSIPIHEIPSRIRFRHFNENGLGTMIKSVFNGSPFLAVNAAYPGQFKPWQFGSVANGYWTGRDGLQHAKEAMEWLVFAKLQVTKEQIPYVIGTDTFRKYGLDGMYSELFNRSVTKALDVLFPGEFTTDILVSGKYSMRSKTQETIGK